MVVSTLLHNGSTVRQSTSALDNKVQVFKINVPQSIQYKPFSPRAERTHGVWTLSPLSPCLLLPCRGLTWGSKTSGDPVLACASTTEGVRMTHELWWGVKMECKKSKGMGISEYSSTVALTAIHWSHAVSSVVAPPGSPRDVCSILCRRKGPVHHSIQTIFMKCFPCARDYARHQR